MSARHRVPCWTAWPPSRPRVLADARPIPGWLHPLDVACLIASMSTSRHKGPLVTFSKSGCTWGKPRSCSATFDVTARPSSCRTCSRMSRRTRTRGRVADPPPVAHAGGVRRALPEHPLRRAACAPRTVVGPPWAGRPGIRPAGARRRKPRPGARRNRHSNGRGGRGARHRRGVRRHHSAGFAGRGRRGLASDRRAAASPDRDYAQQTVCLYRSRSRCGARGTPRRTRVVPRYRGASRDGRRAPRRAP